MSEKSFSALKLFKGTNFLDTMMNIYQNNEYMQSLPVQTERHRRCHFLWMQQKMPVGLVLLKTRGFPFHLLSAGSNLFDPALRQNTDCWTISQRTKMQSDDKLHRWWINATIRSLILPSHGVNKGSTQIVTKVNGLVFHWLDSGCWKASNLWASRKC